MMRRLVVVMVVAGGGLVLGVVVLIGAGAASNPSQCGSGPSPVGQSQLIQLYIKAAQQYNLGADGYAYLAGINEVETKFGTDIATSSAGAVGWMQFEPGTWAEYRITPSGSPAPDGPAGWNDAGDAIYTAARYLAASGAPGDWSGAIFSYNHAGWYVTEVTNNAAGFLGSDGLVALKTAIDQAQGGGQPQPELAALTTTTSSGNGTNTDAGATDTNGTTTNGTTTTAGPTCVGSLPVPVTPGSVAKIQANGLAAAPANAPQAVQNMIAAGNELITYPYSYGGGHCNAAMTIPPGPTSCPGNEENGGEGYDCSGSTSFVLWGGGLGQSVMDGSTDDSTGFMGLGESGPGTWVTWFATTGHVWIIVAGIAMDTSNSYWPQVTPAGTGPRWVPASVAENYELTYGTDASSYVERHPPGL